MSWRRAGCAALCVIGVVIYSLAKKRQTPECALKDEDEEEEKEQSLVVADAAGLSFTSHGSVHRSRASLHSHCSKTKECSAYQAC